MRRGFLRVIFMRQAKQVHIFLYRQRNGQYEYAIFQRSDFTPCWQGVCGGLEGEETILEGARRELWEEAGVTGEFPIYRLDSISFLPAGIFGKKYRKLWGEKTILVPMYALAMPYDGEIRLSDEHLEVRWLPYEQAHDLVYFDSQQTSLYELNERLLRGLMPEAMK